MLNAYSKRKSNLLLLDEDTLQPRNRELFLALQESARFLKTCGVTAAAVGEESAAFPLPVIRDLYDSFEAVLEAYLPFLKRMTVSVTAQGIRLAMDAEADPPLPKTVLPIERHCGEDGTFVTVNAPKGGGAA